MRRFLLSRRVEQGGREGGRPICISAAPCDNESYDIWRLSSSGPDRDRDRDRRGQFSFWRDLSGWNIERNLATHYWSGFIAPLGAPRRLNLHRCSKDRRKRPDEKLARADARFGASSLALARGRSIAREFSAASASVRRQRQLEVDGREMLRPVYPI